MAAKKKQSKFKFDTKYIPMLGAVIVASFVAAVGIVFLDPTYANQTEKPVAASCSVEPGAVAAASSVQLAASGLPASGAYDLLTSSPDGDVVWQMSDRATNNGTVVYSLEAPAEAGEWTYYFTNQNAEGSDLKDRKVYAACSVSVN